VLSFVRTFVALIGVSAGEEGRPLLPRGTCLRCGAAWVGRISGRPRKWCSHACRRAAYEERRAAANGAIAVREVEVSVGVDHDLTSCVEHVPESPAAVRRLLRRLGESSHLTAVAAELRWEPAREELLRLVRRMADESARHFPGGGPSFESVHRGNSAPRHFKAATGQGG